mmetsp:Transcript_11701/g.20751  ORF Transcript_11701/g.20751 Transcript_11701/m.20751 type:complete len:152 (+) Transcript_11701:190-645(+)
MMLSISFVSLALSLTISPAPLAGAFSHTNTKAHIFKRTQVSSTELKYRSLHDGPDVEVELLSATEKQGADSTKMDKDRIDRYGPEDFSQYADTTSTNMFDGGNSEIGLTSDGDGNVGLHKLGRDVSIFVLSSMEIVTIVFSVALFRLYLSL